MEKLKKLNRDILYKIDLKLINRSNEYCLINANDSDDIYIILEEEEIKQ